MWDVLEIIVNGGKSKAAKTSEASASKKAKPKREVQVVSCPSAFPISEKSGMRKRPRDERKKESNQKSAKGSLLDWHETAKEIRKYGASQFVGKQKRDYEDEQYFNLTGRHKKKDKVPLPILRGLKKAAAKRDARARQEAREAGIVLPKAQKEVKKSSSTYRTYGPAPSVGFMKNGVLKVNKKR